MKQNDKEADRMASGSSSEGNGETKFRTIDSELLGNSFYRGEGNATFVIALPNERKVLRLHKSDPEGGDEPAEDDGESRVRLIVDFHKNVMSELMGIYATEPEIVRCNEEDLKAQLRLYEPDRPAKRRHKKVIETYATILPDYTLLPGRLLEKITPAANRSTFCVEIKPKEGYIDGVGPGDMCNYCWKNFVKDLQGKCENYYRPCRLFSGEYFRMHLVFTELITNPRNNFRIFKDGKLVFGEEFKYRNNLHQVLEDWFYPEKSFETNRNTLFEFIRHALLRQFPRSGVDPVPLNLNDIEPYDLFASDCTVVRDLPRGSVLERIQRVQRLYRCGVGSIYDIYSKYSTILNDEMVYSQTDNAENEQIESRAMSSEEQVLVRNYLVHRISRDCSILMAFQEIDTRKFYEISRSTAYENHILKDLCYYLLNSNATPTENVPVENLIGAPGNRFFLFSNAITDLDPKSVHCIEKHHRRAQELLKYKNNLKLEERGGKREVDGEL